MSYLDSSNIHFLITTPFPYLSTITKWLSSDAFALFICRLSGVSGSIRYNDHPLDASTRKKCCHITQDSEMLQNLTLLETMTSAVHLKLGREINSSVRLKIINDILQILGLEKCLHTRVKTLSGGEAKRLSIGLEMITNPPVMFFDEPTSGLDSSSSLQVMTHLRELAKSGRTIVCAIHQPSSRMLELIDQVYLVSKGTCLYSGPLSQMVHHFEHANFHCPPQYNRAEFALEVANNERYGDYEKLLEESDKSESGVQIFKARNERVGVDPDSMEMEPMIVRVDIDDDNISKVSNEWEGEPGCNLVENVNTFLVLVKAAPCTIQCGFLGPDCDPHPSIVYEFIQKFGKSPSTIM